MSAYGCNNHPKRHAESGFWVMNLVFDTPDGLPVHRPVWVEHRMSTDCKYDKQTSDPGCAGCEMIK